MMGTERRIELKCAIYARYSSEKQNASSIDDQVRKCCDYAVRCGWEILPDHVYLDEGVSGATEDRDGLRQMLAAAAVHPPAFTCVLVDDTSRLSRSLGDADRIVKELKFAGIKIVFVAQGFDSDSESAGMLTAIFGGINEQYLVDLGKKTYRGVEGLARRKLHTGGRCFGYRNVPIEHESEKDCHGRPVITGVRLEIDSHQTKIVQQIFQMYAEGRSLKSISKKLNQEGIQSPQPQKGRVSQSWCPSSIRTILRNERYRGGGVSYGAKRERFAHPRPASASIARGQKLIGCVRKFRNSALFPMIFGSGLKAGWRLLRSFTPIPLAKTVSCTHVR